MTTYTIASRDGRRDRVPDVLEDGDVLRVPLQFADSAITNDVLALHNGMGSKTGHRPGYIFASGVAADVARAEAVTSCALRKQELENAWRAPGSRPPIADATREEAYAAREKYLASAWRTSK